VVQNNTKIALGHRKNLTLNFPSIPAYNNFVIADLHWQVGHVINAIRTRLYDAPDHTVWSYTTIISIIKWFGGATVTESHLKAEGCVFDSRPIAVR